MDTVVTKQGNFTRIYTPADANTLLCVAEHCFASMNTINLLIIDKQKQLQYLTLEQARKHFKAGAGIWDFASNEIPGKKPDIVLACAGDYATQETLGAAEILMKRLPHISFRVVNVVDIMCLYIKQFHPNGMSEEQFADLFTEDVHVVFAFHGFPGCIHQLIHKRPNVERFHVKGYLETGTTTTPFDMLVLNKTSRFHIAGEAVRRIEEHRAERKVAMDEQVQREFADVRAFCNEYLEKHSKYIVEQFDDLPELKNWTWDSELADSVQKKNGTGNHKQNA